jgi:hypothetical protein
LLQHHYKLLLGLTLFLVVALSCSFPGGAKPTEEPTAAVPTQSPEEALTAIAGQLTGNKDAFTFTITEDQINTLLNQRLQSLQDKTISEAKVDLQPGRIVITGKISQQQISLDMNATLEPYVDENGLPKVKLITADLGPIPVPPDLGDTISEIFMPIIETAIAESGQNIKLQSISVSDTSMVISGQIQ